MKYHRLFFFDNPYLASCPCGTAAIAIMGVASIAATAANAKMQADANQSQMNFAAGENEESRRFAAEQAEIQRQYQSAEWLRQYERQSSDWYKQLNALGDYSKQMFDYEAQYNSPQNQMARLRSAGLNPAASLGSNSGLIAASSGNVKNAPTPTPPTGGSVSGAAASAPSTQGVNLHAPQIDFSSFGSFLKDAAEAYKTNAETRPSIDKILAEIDNIVTDTTSKKLLQEYQIGQNYIMNLTKNVKVRQAYAEVGVAYSQMKLNESLGREADAKSVLAAAEKFLKEAETNLTKEQYSQAAFMTAHMLESFTNEQNLKKSQAVANYASAKYNNALAKTEDEIRDWKVGHEEQLFKVEQCLAGIQKNKLFVSDETLDEQVSAFAAQLKREHILTDTAQQELEIAIKNKDWYEVKNLLNPIFGTLNQTTRTGMDVIKFTE
jgi:hypothetical protein